MHHNKSHHITHSSKSSYGLPLQPNWKSWFSKSIHAFALGQRYKYPYSFSFNHTVFHPFYQTLWKYKCFNIKNLLSLFFLPSHIYFPCLFPCLVYIFAQMPLLQVSFAWSKLPSSNLHFILHLYLVLKTIYLKLTSHYILIYCLCPRLEA